MGGRSGDRQRRRALVRRLAGLGGLLLALALATPALAVEPDYDAFNAVSLTEVHEGQEVRTQGAFNKTVEYDTSSFTLQSEESAHEKHPGFNGCVVEAEDHTLHTYFGAKSAWMQLLPQGSGHLTVTLTWDSSALAEYVPMIIIWKPAPVLPEAPSFSTELEARMHNYECAKDADSEGHARKDGVLSWNNGGKEVSIAKGEALDIQTLSVCGFVKKGELPPPACEKEESIIAGPHPGGPTHVKVEFIPNDTDGDGVPDSEDDCPTEFGTVRGCPDQDKDGVPTNDPVLHIEDDCPTEFGTVRGCPDPDSDGVPTNDPVLHIEDDCPTEFGTVHGCPDPDGDGIPTRDPVTHVEDSCPQEFGLPSAHGCPDGDGDGVPDKEDSCKTLPGPSRFAGCPDTDGDGVPDNLDICPTEWANAAISQPVQGRMGCLTPLNATLHYLFGQATPRKQLLRYFNVEAPIGARVVLACRGRACPRSLPFKFTVTKQVVPMIGYLRHGHLRKGHSVWIPVGTTITATVTDNGALGQRRSLAPTRRGEPKVTDQCVAGARVVKCS
jgi:hypothetical protein